MSRGEWSFLTEKLERLFSLRSVLLRQPDSGGDRWTQTLCLPCLRKRSAFSLNDEIYPDHTPSLAYRLL